MIEENTGVTPEDQAFVQEQFLPAVEDVTQRFIEKATSVAAREGWLPEHAQALALLGTAPFLEALLSDVPPASEPAKAQLLRPTAVQRSARSAALLVMHRRPSSRKRASASRAAGRRCRARWRSAPC